MLHFYLEHVLVAEWPFTARLRTPQWILCENTLCGRDFLKGVPREVEELWRVQYRISFSTALRSLERARVYDPWETNTPRKCAVDSALSADRSTARVAPDGYVLTIGRY